MRFETKNFLDFLKKVRNTITCTSDIIAEISKILYWVGVSIPFWPILE